MFQRNLEPRLDLTSFFICLQHLCRDTNQHFDCIFNFNIVQTNVILFGDSGILGYVKVMLADKWVTTFRKNIVPPSSGSKRPETSQFDSLHYEVTDRLL
jgi:hypothetical protein